MHSHYVDQTLPCRDCGTNFTWTAGEQEFYTTKGLTNSPSRCPACRRSAKEARETGRPAGGRPREMFAVVCDRCGIQTQVPFFPRVDRPVYCSACYDAVRTEDLPGGTP
jgi:CxxC-x17-CxxC domain-containing protein